MPKVLIQFAHPVFSKSRVQKTLLKHCHDVEGVTINDLYEQYPDLYIDVRREQQLLLQHDIIVLQHPFFWYSSPAILKQWQDLVLEYNWAYGPEGDALKGKKVLSVISCGTAQEAYQPSGQSRYTMQEFLIPFKQTVSLCKMEYLPPFILYGTHHISQEKLEECGTRYARILKGLAAGTIRPEHYGQLEHINDLVLPDRAFNKVQP